MMRRGVRPATRLLPLLMKGWGKAFFGIGSSYMSNNDSILSSLDLAPDWARQPAGLQVSSAPDRPSRSGTRPGAGQGYDRDRRQSSEPRSRNRREPHKTVGGREPGSDRPLPLPRKETPRERIQLPIRISFIPERRGLKPIADWLAGTRKAHSLESVAAMFLSKPEYFAVKLESLSREDGSDPLLMRQCNICKTVFIEKSDTVAHILAKHLDMFYKVEEIEAEPPKGNFQCVAQCKMSGELLGPPNYHGYNERVLEVHKTRFPNMALEEYRKHIVNRKEPELLEQWKISVSRQVRYSTIEPAPPESFARRADVDDHFMRHHVRGVIREGRRFIVPGPVMLESSVTQLVGAVNEGWRRERRFSARMGMALQPAFRHLGLHVFKAADKIPFVTALRPHYIAPGQTADAMRAILEQLENGPCNSRLELISSILPTAPPDSPQAAEIISRLCWLVERGHVIEFFDGRLVVPSHGKVAENK